MRLPIVAACLCWLVFTDFDLEAQQTPTPGNVATEEDEDEAEAELNLVGNRFSPLEYSDLDDAQRTMVRHILEGSSSARGPMATEHEPFRLSPQPKSLKGLRRQTQMTSSDSCSFRVARARAIIQISTTKLIPLSHLVPTT